MGNYISSESRESRSRSDAIEDLLGKDRIKLRKEIKVLLLGAAESGKTTVLRQIRGYHGQSYSEEELQAFKKIVFANIIESMRAILVAMETMQLPLCHDSNDNYANIIMDMSPQFEGEPMPPEAVVAIQNLWLDPNVQNAFQRRNEYQLLDSAKYFFEAIDRIGGSIYIPTNQDILLTYDKSLEIAEATAHIGAITYRFWDVGGLRSESKKWIHCFENVTAILFVVAISEYDQMLAGDKAVNRMEEAMTLYDSICNSRWFIKTDVILLLNKHDLFVEKLSVSPLKRHFPDYD
ncbi:guanine nucleotide-binding protein subunit alpha, partial [Mortierella sp. AM989]